MGYAGGTSKSPTYEEVCSDGTGHAEAVEIIFDPGVVSYERLLEVFFLNHDPTTPDRQGPNVGSQYRSVVVALDDRQASVAEKVIQELDQSNQHSHPVVTQVLPATEFWRAEEYHQRYYEKKGLVLECKL